MGYDSREDTRAHIGQVQICLSDVILDLQAIAIASRRAKLT